MAPSDTRGGADSREAGTAGKGPSEATACGLLMLRLGRAAAARMGAALAGLEMHPHDYAVLHALNEEGGVSQTELAATLRVHPSNLVALLDGLEAEGLVERRRDPTDRRRQLLELAPGGRERLDRAKAAVENTERDLLAPLASADRRRLHAYLEQLAAHSCAARAGKGRRC